mmetsp:Transcript_14627/g.42883  ORF Transcript_14627/g.42883 Transcript_14627/m.42883 type:complete len:212 (-) Transcript_14627:255-890(-)
MPTLSLWPSCCYHVRRSKGFFFAPPAKARATRLKPLSAVPHPIGVLRHSANIHRRHYVFFGPCQTRPRSPSRYPPRVFRTSRCWRTSIVPGGSSPPPPPLCGWPRPRSPERDSGCTRPNFSRREPYWGRTPESLYHCRPIYASLRRTLSARCTRGDSRTMSSFSIQRTGRGSYGIMRQGGAWCTHCRGQSWRICWDSGQCPRTLRGSTSRQ